ncbi:MAG: hypothetical protein U1F11_08755 [Steroidobacteraceae bacterium]
MLQNDDSTRRPAVRRALLAATLGAGIAAGAVALAAASSAAAEPEREPGRTAAPAAARESGREDTAITIYSTAQPGAISPDLYRPVPGGGVPNGMAVPGYALVRHERPIRIEAGRSTLRFTDVAGLIDPTTVTFTSLTDPGTRVLEQNFQFDLVSSQKLLQRFLDRPITVERTLGNQASTQSGTLLSSADGLVLKGADGSITALRDYSAVRFPDLPGGLITRPTLEWALVAPKAGPQRARVTYQTGGITWWADYNLVFNEGRDANSGLLDVSAWVSIINQSGASYPDARLKLIAGDVHRAPVAEPPMVGRAMAMAAKTMESDAAGFEQKAFFEFHLYTLGRRTTLPDNSTKQIELFDQARQVPAKKVLVYYGLQQSYGWDAPMTERELGLPMNRKVDVYLEFRNDKQYGLGVPLPSGRLRVSQLDAADGSLEFIGEDRIDHTPKDETVRVKLGSAFDVVGERRQVDFAIDTRGRWLEEEIEVKLRNHKDQPVEVLVKENLYRWTNWKILTHTLGYTKEDARTIHFPVRVAKDGEAVVRYRVRYTW